MSDIGVHAKACEHAKTDRKMRPRLGWTCVCDNCNLLRNSAPALDADNCRLRDENAQLRQQLEEAQEEADRQRDGLFAESQAHEQLKRELADLRALLQTVERELATEKSKSEAFATVAAEAKERIDVVEGERDAALKAGRVLVAANTRHFNEAREACEALQVAQRENGVLRGALENAHEQAKDVARRLGPGHPFKAAVDLVADIARAALRPGPAAESKPWPWECCHGTPIDTPCAECASHDLAVPTPEVPARCDTTKGPCACGAWH